MFVMKEGLDDDDEDDDDMDKEEEVKTVKDTNKDEEIKAVKDTNKLEERGAALRSTQQNVDTSLRVTCSHTTVDVKNNVEKGL